MGVALPQDGVRKNSSAMIASENFGNLGIFFFCHTHSCFEKESNVAEPIGTYVRPRRSFGLSIGRGAKCTKT